MRSTPFHRFTVISSIGLLVLCGAVASAAAQSGTYFRDLSGVNGGPNGVNGIGNFHGLTDTALSHYRSNLQWHRVQPTENGGYKDNEIQTWINDVYQNDKANGADTLTLLAYTANWAENQSPRTYEFQGDTYHITNNNGTLHLRGNGFDQDIPSSWNLAPTRAHSADWKAYVSHTATKLHDAGVRNFQIWNEPNGRPPFYAGDMDLPTSYGDGADNDAAAIANDSDDNFYNLIHKPAADAIHDAGGKVVFGGWPTPKPIKAYADWLDYHTTANANDKQDAWDTIDALDMHYRGVGDMEYMRQRAVQAGHPDIDIWQTEIGNTGQEGFIPSFYPRFSHWALEHNDGDADRYQVYFFPYGGYGDIHSNTLVYNTDHKLTINGMAMQTMGRLFGGGPMKVYNGVSNNQGLSFNDSHRTFGQGNSSEGTSGIESFKINDRIVVAVHLDDTETTGDMIITFNDLGEAEITSADRVTPWGDRIDLLDTLKELQGGGVSFTVPTDGIAIPEGGTLGSDNPFPRTFFVEVGTSPIPEPATAVMFGIGATACFLRRRR